MRKVFSSQRVETAEGVAMLLREAGIEIRLLNGRSYHGKRSGQFSYLDQSNSLNHPSVWVLHADDQPRARELLRAARLLDSTRHELGQNGPGYALRGDAAAPPRNWAWRIRLALLALIALIAVVIVLRHRSAAIVARPVSPAESAAPVQTPPPSPPAQAQENRVRIETVK